METDAPVCPDEAEVIGRRLLAGALQVAAWHHPRRQSAQAAARQVIDHQVADRPKRGSLWLGDGQAALSVEQARRAVRAWCTQVTAPWSQVAYLTAYASVLAALDGSLEVPADEDQADEDQADEDQAASG